MRVCVGMVLGVLVIGCREVPQAPNPPSSPPPAFTLVHVDATSPLTDAGQLSQPTLLVEGGTSLHVLYGSTWVGATRYAGCPTYCAEAMYWRAGEVDSSFYFMGDGGQVAAALASTGIHLFYQSTAPNTPTVFLSYGWCPGACYRKIAWRTVVIDTLEATYAKPGGVSAVIDSTTGVQSLYIAPGGQVRYAHCPAACSDVTSWRRAVIDTTWPGNPATAIASAQGGRLHALYFDSAFGLRYATCAASCEIATNWQRATIATVKPPSYYWGFFARLAIGPDGRLHALARLDSLTYLTCPASCTTPSAWQRVTFDSLVDGGGALAVGRDGSVHVVALRPSGGATYAHCDSACTKPVAWSRIVIDSTLRVTDVSLDLMMDGKPVAALATWYDVYVALMR